MTRATPATDPQSSTRDLRVLGTTPLIPPHRLRDRLEASAVSVRTVIESRDGIRSILRGDDRRFLLVVGPCSIHDPEAAMAYARNLAALARRYADRMAIVMRVYFEKPRTTIGWKGLINDPHLNGTFDMAHGLNLARRLLLDITALGLPAGTEMLDPITPQYIGGLVSWASIGARTIESQTHRQMASGLSMPVGFKNSTDGNAQVAIDAMRSSRSGHHFLGIDDEGRCCIVQTRGNTDGHLILRGGTDEPNYTPEAVAAAADRLRAVGLRPAFMVDCSHANSGKKHQRQEAVWNSLLEQRSGDPDSPIIGAMVESNLHAGSQPIPDDKSQLRYGVSITDECIGWEKTEQMLAEGYERLGG